MASLTAGMNVALDRNGPRTGSELQRDGAASINFGQGIDEEAVWTSEILRSRDGVVEKMNWHGWSPYSSVGASLGEMQKAAKFAAFRSFYTTFFQRVKSPLDWDIVVGHRDVSPSMSN